MEANPDKNEIHYLDVYTAVSVGSALEIRNDVATVMLPGILIGSGATFRDFT